ncbi:MAG TPA: hypothetical protein VLA72_05230 [Anaerolineales bacterium]|nr:hypothetical protein [Anaerolineales bacterium]
MATTSWVGIDVCVDSSIGVSVVVGIEVELITGTVAIPGSSTGNGAQPTIKINKKKWDYCSDI